jgi:hypothetical protein
VFAGSHQQLYIYEYFSLVYKGELLVPGKNRFYVQKHNIPYRGEYF